MERRPIRIAVWSDDGSVPAVVLEAVLHNSDRLVWTGVFTDASSFVEPIDVVVLPIRDRHLDGRAHGVSTLAALQPSARVLLMADSFPPRLRHAAHVLGITAFATTRSTHATIAAAIVDTADGKRANYVATDESAGSGQPSWLGEKEGLSQRESQVLELCADGLSNREIADQLYLNVETVKSHLKRIYQRLDIHNRAAAAAFVHRYGQMPAFRPIDWTAPSRPATAATAASAGRRRRLAEELGLDDETLRERRNLLGLADAPSANLRRHLPAVLAGLESHLLRTLSRWRDNEYLARLVATEEAASRVLDHQRRYVTDLFGGDFGQAHTDAMLRTGAAHHRLGLEPQWYVLAFVDLICEHLPLLLLEPVTVEAVDDVCTLISAVLTDVCLGLDAYELSVAQELLSETGPPEAPDLHPAAPGEPGAPSAGPHGRPPNDTDGRRRTMLKISVSDVELERRRAFIELDDARISTLRQLAPAIDAAVPATLAAFYRLVHESPHLTGLMTPEMIERLMAQVAAYWTQLASSSFERSHAASRIRVGVIHERIGISPQFYLAGLAQQLRSIVHSVASPDTPILAADPLAAVDALVRAVVFDLAFVLDAYIDARIESFLDAERFASHLVAHLATAVAVVDSRNRIQYANDQLLAYVGFPAGVLRRMPVEDALHLDGVVDTIDAARGADSGRASTVVDDRGRRLRITCVALQRATTGAEGLIAVVVDDLTEVIRASNDTGAEDARFATVLEAVGAVAWEIDIESLTVLAVSRAGADVFGARDVDLVGSSSWLHRLAAEDRDSAISFLRSIDIGERRHATHRIVPGDGSLIWMTTSAVGTRDAAGRRTVSAVSVPTDVPPDT
ncbi:MAG: protoglobin domain-containing protein [Acidimicrobiia bacterium]